MSSSWSFSLLGLGKFGSKKKQSYIPEKSTFIHRLENNFYRGSNSPSK
jgi:hypothetical protein